MTHSIAEEKACRDALARLANDEAEPEERRQRAREALGWGSRQDVMGLLARDPHLSWEDAVERPHPHRPASSDDFEQYVEGTYDGWRGR